MPLVLCSNQSTPSSTRRYPFESKGICDQPRPILRWLVSHNNNLQSVSVSAQKEWIMYSRVLTLQGEERERGGEEGGKREYKIKDCGWIGLVKVAKSDTSAPKKVKTRVLGIRYCSKVKMRVESGNGLCVSVDWIKEKWLMAIGL